MTLYERNLAMLIRTIVNASIREAAAKARTSKFISGTVEQVDDDLDVTWVRADQETASSDPTQSMNYEAPGIIPATRLGEAYNGDQVRVAFDGPAGASSFRTSAPLKITLPFSSETGQHIVLDGETGFFAFYDEDGDLVGYLDASQWFIGKPGEALAQLDPLGGLHLRDLNNELRVALSAPEGLIVREPTSGISGLTANWDGIVVLDPTTGERISITSGNTSAVPTPHWASTASSAVSTGTTLYTPSIAAFTTDDFDIRFTCESAAADLGAQTHSAPLTYTELSDVSSSGSGITIGTSAAYKDPAASTTLTTTFTGSTGSWTRQNGHTVIVKGAGTTSPSLRGTSTTAVIESTSRTITFPISAPAGTTTGDLVVAFVSLAGKNIPVGWTTPDGWRQLGVNVSGLGTTHVLGSGAWYNKIHESTPLTETVSINMSAAGSLTKVHATVVAVQNPYAFPAGLDIRMNNHSMPRGLVAENTETANAGPWAVGDLPKPLNEITNVSLKAGRRYQINFNNSFMQWASLNSANEIRVAIHRNAGGGYSEFHLVERVRFGSAGTYNSAMSGNRIYIPPSDETSSWKIDVSNVNSVAGQGYSVTFNASTGAPRILSITDVGADF